MQIFFMLFKVLLEVRLHFEMFQQNLLICCIKRMKFKISLEFEKVNWFLDKIIVLIISSVVLPFLISQII